MWQSYLVPPRGSLLWDSGGGGRFESVQGVGIPWFSSVLAALDTAYGRCIPVAVPQRRSYLCGRSTSG